MLQNSEKQHVFSNYDALAENGIRDLRRVCLDIAEAAVIRAIPYTETKKRVSLDGGVLRVAET